MFNKPHILFLCCALSVVFLACRSKKTSASHDLTPPGPPPNVSKDLKMARFGNLYVSGCSERIKGNLQEAVKIFEECKSIDPGNAAVHYELGTIYKLLGVNDQALANAKFCAEADNRNEWYQLLLVDCYNATRQYNQALKIREGLVKNFPQKNEFKEDLAIQYAVMGQYEKSYKIYDELEKTYGLNEQISLNKVKLLKSQKKFKEIETELKKLSDSDPSEPRYYAYLAEFYLEQNDMEKAKSMYDKILAIDPGNPTVNLALHDYYSAKGKEDMAFSHLKKAFQNPDLDVSTKAGVVGIYYKKAENRSEQAKEKGLELVKVMLDVHPNATESNALYADFLRLDNKTQEALKYYYRAASNEKRDFRIWDNLLYIDYELGLHDSLEHHSRAAIEMFPSQPMNYLYNGVAWMQLKDYKKAIVVLTDGLEFVIDDKALRMKFLSALGDAYFYNKDYTNSDRIFEEALKTDSDDTHILNNYAYYLSLRNEKLDRAEKLSKKSNELRPKEANYMDTYGWILYQQKKYKEAEEWLGAAAKASPKNATILEHYGDVLFRQNKTNEAMIQWEAAKQAGGNSETLLNKIKTRKIND